jgi:hypothetical protein
VELEHRLASLTHDEYAERLNELASALRRGAWAALTRGVEELVRVGKLKTTPPDPLGGAWVVDVDGALKSSVRASDEQEKALTRRAPDMLARAAPIGTTSP